MSVPTNIKKGATFIRVMPSTSFIDEVATTVQISSVGPAFVSVATSISGKPEKFSRDTLRAVNYHGHQPFLMTPEAHMKRILRRSCNYALKLYGVKLDHSVSDEKAEQIYNALAHLMGVEPTS